MLCALTVRRLKPGAYDDFVKAWSQEDTGAPSGWVRFNIVRNVQDPDEVVAFGFFDGTLEDLRRSQQDFDYSGQRAAIEPLVAETGADGIYEVVTDRTA